MLGVRAGRGRTISPADEEPVAVLSHRLWKARFAADPAVLGKAIRLNRHEFVIIGIASEEFRGVRLDSPADVWVPIGMHARLEPASAHYFPSRGSRWFQVIGRLRPGITASQASAALGPIAERLAQTYPDNHERGFAVIPANETQSRSRPAVWLWCTLGCL